MLLYAGSEIDLFYVAVEQYRVRDRRFNFVIMRDERREEIQKFSVCVVTGAFGDLYLYFMFFFFGFNKLCTYRG